MIDFEQISLDDYFRKNVEFRMWLMQRKRISLDQLKDRKDRERYFKRFMRHWNDGELQDVYYQGKIKPTDVVVNKIQSAETRLYQIPSSSNSDNHSRQKLTSSKDLHSAVADEEERRQKFQMDRKRERKLVKERVDELVPKEPGKQGQLEEKRARREANWERERQSGAADTELTDKDIYGGGSDYNAMLARQRQRQEMRYREKNEHLAGRKRELDAKEEKTMEMFKRMAQERFGNQ